MTGLSSCHTSTGVEVVGFDGEQLIYSDPVAESVDLQRQSFNRLGGRDYVGRWQIATAVGGNVFQMSCPTVGGVRPSMEDRGVITQFSPRSRSRMLWFLNSLNRDAVQPNQLWFVTLTYPAVWDRDPSAWKLHLKLFRQRLERAWGRMAIVWKLEFQERGAPHFHLICHVSPGMARGIHSVNERKDGERTVRDWRGGQLREFRQWCSRAWFDVVGSGDRKHLRAGTNVEPLLSWRRVISYAGKYMAKCTKSPLFDEETGEVKGVGKFWGIWRKELFPRHVGKMELSVQAWLYVWRTYRKYSERVLRRPVRGDLPSLVKAFVPYEFVAKVLDQSTMDWLPPWQQRGHGELWN